LESIKAYDQSGREIASLPSEMPIKIPFWEPPAIYQLNKNAKKEYFSLDFIAGAHQEETMFFGLIGERILPVCLKEIEAVEGPEDCLFYSGRTGSLQVEDLDKDGYVEVVTYGDEYPAGGGRGRAVALAIYRFNGEWFVSQTSKDYDRYFALAVAGKENIIKNSERSETSVKTFEQIKDFWKGE